jgi:hypothetical protein
VVVVEKVARDGLEVAVDPETVTGVAAAAIPCGLWAVGWCPCGTLAWWTAWVTSPAAERTTRSSRHDADPESDGTKRRSRRRDVWELASCKIVFRERTMVEPPQWACRE